MHSRNYEEKIQSHVQRDAAQLHPAVASRQIDFEAKHFIHASMIRALPQNLHGSEEEHIVPVLLLCYDRRIQVLLCYKE